MNNLELALSLLCLLLWVVGGIIACGFTKREIELDGKATRPAFLIFLFLTWPLMGLIAILTPDNKPYPSIERDES